MIYYEDEKILIRNMKPSDAQIITDAEIAQGWSQTVDKYELRLKHQAEGRCVALVAEFEGNVAGYLNVYRSAETGSFAERGLPEIVDFGVLEKYRKRGIGNKLMDAAEEIAAGYADAVTLCVGLHSGYGSAQRMYAKRGYLPDGSGAWYRDAVCPPHAECRNDDELVLYMSKLLR